MKERKIYICEKCGLEIEDDYKTMIDHEHDDHVEPKGYQQPQAVKYQTNQRYPAIINVTMGDGATIQYCMRKIVTPKEESPRGNEDNSSDDSTKETP